MKMPEYPEEALDEAKTEFAHLMKRICEKHNLKDQIEIGAFIQTLLLSLSSISFTLIKVAAPEDVREMFIQSLREFEYEKMEVH